MTISKKLKKDFMEIVKQGIRRLWQVLENRLLSCLLLPCFLFFSLFAKGLPSPALTHENSGRETTVRSAVSLADIPTDKMGGTPVISIESSMVPFQAELGQEEVQYYYVTGSGLSVGDIILLELSDPSGAFTISSLSSGYGTTVEIVADGDDPYSEMIAVKFAPSVSGAHTGTITHTTVGAEPQTLTVEGNVTSLPVEWLSFTAKADKGAVTLDWTTASEENHSHFEVEVSGNPLKGFEQTGRVESKVGNSKSATSYQFKYSLGAVNGIRYFRLKQVDFDNRFEYSKFIAAEIRGAGAVKVNVAPNPISDASLLNITVEEAGSMNIILFNTDASAIYSKRLELEAGVHQVPLHFYHQISAGVYILVTEFKGKIERQKLIK